MLEHLTISCREFQESFIDQMNRVSLSKKKGTKIGMFRPIRMDHTNCLQVAIKTHSFILEER